MDQLRTSFYSGDPSKIDLLKTATVSCAHLDIISYLNVHDRSDVWMNRREQD